MDQTVPLHSTIAIAIARQTLDAKLLTSVKRFEGRCKPAIPVFGTEWTLDDAASKPMTSGISAISPIIRA
ncbi:hypothetical protein D6D17_06203 [Aureobasidium pullulans]|nr:hypothetical protein D6D17_06203 [Aureobasidium pullulans]